MLQIVIVYVKLFECVVTLKLVMQTWTCKEILRPRTPHDFKLLYRTDSRKVPANTNNNLFLYRVSDAWEFYT